MHSKRNIPILLGASLLFACGEVAVDSPDAGGDGPQIAEVTPARVPKAGGVVVTVTGTGFLSEANTAFVVVGDQKVSATVVDDSTVTFMAPEGPAFDISVPLVVFTPEGFDELAPGIFFNPSPQVHTIEPDFGPSVGGSEITITGSGFQDYEPGTTVIRVGSATVTDFTVVDDSSIAFTAPPLEDEPFQALDVVVDNANGQAVLPSVFRYTAQGFLAVTSHRASFLPEWLWHIDPENGTATPIVELDQRVIAVTLGPDGTLYGMVKNPRTLVSIDPITGSLSPIGPMKSPEGGSYAYNRLTFVGSNLFTYNRSTRLLSQVDPATGVVTDKGDTAHLGSQTVGLASPSGTTLYWMNVMNGTLYTVNPNTGVFTAGVSLTGVSANVHGAVVANGKLYVISLNTSSGESRLWELNPATGIFAEVGELPNRIHSLANTPSTF